MSQQDNIAAQTAFGEAVNSGNLAAIADIVAPGSIDHDAAPGQGPGPEGYQAMFRDLRRAFPICTSRSSTCWRPRTSWPSRIPSRAPTAANSRGTHRPASR